MITMDEALRSGLRFAAGAADVPAVRPVRTAEILTKGMARVAGAAVGRAVFDSATAKAWADRGEQVVLVRKETNPDDLEGMIAAAGILTARGGKTPHAAVVAPGWAPPACAAPRRWTSTRSAAPSGWAPW
jgi:pyruvate,orthophosphate dikinase